MEFDEFVQLLQDHLPPGTVLDNPQRGTSTIVWCNDERVCYRRGDLKLYINHRDLYDAYSHFAGGNVTARDVKDYAPAVFDTARKGHNCHSTFLFLVLKKIGIVTEIWGRGRAGSPFGVSIPGASGIAVLLSDLAELRRRRAALESDGDAGEPGEAVLDQIRFPDR